MVWDEPRKSAFTLAYDQSDAYSLVNHGLHYIHLFLKLRCNDISDREIAAILSFIARFIYRSQLFSNDADPDERIVAGRNIIIQLYARVVEHAFRAVDIPPSTFTALWHPLSVIMDHMFGSNKGMACRSDDVQWKIDFHDLYPVLVIGLQNATRPAYDVFIRNRCFERIGLEPVQDIWTEVVLAYVSGLVKAAARLKEIGTIPGMLNADLRRYIDYLHEPDNLLIACIAVACTPSGSRCSDETGSMEQRMANLASLCPGHDGWERCQDRLRLYPVARDEMGDVYIRKDILSSFLPTDDPLQLNLEAVRKALDGLFDTVTKQKDHVLLPAPDIVRPSPSLSSSFSACFIAISKFGYARSRERTPLDVTSYTPHAQLFSQAKRSRFGCLNLKYCS
jgi:hypothetical protein